MANLHQSGLRDVMAREIAAGKPLLGICLGCQILLEYSPENDTKTLGLIPGRCDIFTPDLTEEDGAPINIPHMGWNTVNTKKPCPLFNGISPESEFLFRAQLLPESGSGVRHRHHVLRPGVLLRARPRRPVVGPVPPRRKADGRA